MISHYSSLTCKDDISTAPNIKAWFWQTQRGVYLQVNAALHSDEGYVHHAGLASAVLVHHDLIHVVFFGAISFCGGREIMLSHHYPERRLSHDLRNQQ